MADIRGCTAGPALCTLAFAATQRGRCSAPVTTPAGCQQAPAAAGIHSCITTLPAQSKPLLEHCVPISAQADSLTAAALLAACILFGLVTAHVMQLAVVIAPPLALCLLLVAAPAWWGPCSHHIPLRSQDRGAMPLSINFTGCHVYGMLMCSCVAQVSHSPISAPARCIAVLHGCRHDVHPFARHAAAGYRTSMQHWHNFGHGSLRTGHRRSQRGKPSS